MIFNNDSPAAFVHLFLLFRAINKSFMCTRTVVDPMTHNKQNLRVDTSNQVVVYNSFLSCIKMEGLQVYDQKQIKES